MIAAHPRLLTLAGLLIAGSAILSACGDDNPGTDDPADAGDTTDDTANGDTGDVGEDTADTTDVGTDPMADADTGDTGPDTGDVSDADDADTTPPPCESDWPTIEPTTDGTVIDPIGIDPAEPLIAGQARVGQMRVTPDTAGHTTGCRIGDWLLENEQIRVCVDGLEPVSTIMFDGGGISDITSPDDTSDSFLLMRPASNFLVASADTIEMVNDGSNGDPAVLRVTGPEAPIRFFAGTIGNPFPLQNVIYTTEYRLDPGAPYIEVVTWAQRETNLRTSFVASDYVAPGDTARSWFGTYGFETPISTEPVSFYAAISDSHGYGVYAEGLEAAAFVVPVLKSPLSELRYGGGRLCPDTPSAARRYYTFGDDTEVIREHFADFFPELPTSEVTLTTTGNGGLFEIRNTEGSVAVVRINPPDARVISLADGSYEISPVGWQHGGDIPVQSFGVGGATNVNITPPGTGILSASVVTGPPGSPTNLGGLVRVDGPVGRDLMPVSEAEQFILPPGDYTATISRGETYEVITTPFTIEIDVVTDLETNIDRVLEFDGWIAGDLHQHQTQSPDSVVTNEQRIRSNIATGLDFIAPSDHDAAGIFEPIMDDLDVRDRLTMLTGTELSLGAGHMNAFPWLPDTDLASNGGIPLGYRVENSRDFVIYTPSEIAQLALDGGAQLLQINHPRDLALALFDTAGFNPVLDPDDNTSTALPDTFNAIEVFNESTIDMSCLLLRDLHGLLRYGWPVVATGNSDTHSLSKWVGFPRNYVFTGENDPSLISDQDLVDAIVAQQVSVSGGVILMYDDVLPGDLLDGSGGPVDLDFTASTPGYSAIDEIIVYIDGIESERIAVTSNVEDLEDYAGTITVDVTEDAFVTLFAHGANAMTSIGRGEMPFGFMNAVYIDADGDGAFTARGVSGEDDLSHVTGVPFCVEM